MNRSSVSWCKFLRSAVFLLVSAAAVCINAQSANPTNYTLPVVTIRSTDAFASWAGDTGTFTVFRDGPTNATLNIYYLIGGTATNGVDYDTIGNWVMILAGVRTNTITIAPLDHSQTNIATVVLKLAPSPMLPPVNYEIGYPAAATVFITPPGITNIPPLVKLFAPTNGSIFYSPTDIRLGVFGSDPDGFVSSVEFFAGTNRLGTVSAGVILDPPFPEGTGPGTRAFFLVWSNVPPGDYVLTAKATDNAGASTISAPVGIAVKEGPPPHTNLPPVVRIQFPQNGATFSAPATVQICAAAYDLDGYVSTVEFFSGDTSLGIKTNNPVSARMMNPFCLVWSNVPPGGYILTAKATDNEGASTVSAPVNIKVQEAPPPTNYPPVVRITSPANGAYFRGPLDLPSFAYAKDVDDRVTSVEFFEGTNSLGLGSGYCSLLGAGPTPLPYPCPTNLFVLVWSNAPPGAYLLSAKATDERGASSTSEPVHITILPPLPPPTNRPPVVSIVATDPIAIEGTNCWPWLGLDTAVPTWSNWSSNLAVFRFFTNCGPKNAIFNVRRFGDTNQDLTVSYEIGGTAINGVDYAPLSGSVTIPAGDRHALITLVPLDDGPPDITSTVILKLAPSTNYLIGFPRSAAGVILDGQFPRPIAGLLPDKSFELSAPGPDGAWFHIDYSMDLMNWTSLGTNQVVNGFINFIDPDASGGQARFYRAVPELTAPSD
jgi:hypothetical protein